MSVWKSKVTSLMHLLIFVSPARSIKDFSDSEAACNVSRAKNKINYFVTNQNGNLSPSKLHSHLKLSSQQVPLAQHWPTGLPHKKPLLPFSVQRKEQVWVTVKGSYVYEMLFPDSLMRREAIFSHTLTRITKALCKATHPHMVIWSSHYTGGWQDVQ